MTTAKKRTAKTKRAKNAPRTTDERLDQLEQFAVTAIRKFEYYDQLFDASVKLQAVLADTVVKGQERTRTLFDKHLAFTEELVELIAEVAERANPAKARKLGTALATVQRDTHALSKTMGDTSSLVRDAVTIGKVLADIYARIKGHK